MLQFQMPTVTREPLANNRARFVVEPLDRGFGHTFGNALRRVLLSTIVAASAFDETKYLLGADVEGMIENLLRPEPARSATSSGGTRRLGDPRPFQRPR